MPSASAARDQRLAGDRVEQQRSVVAVVASGSRTARSATRRSWRRSQRSAAASSCPARTSVTELRSVNEWSTAFCLAHGEITSSGMPRTVSATPALASQRRVGDDVAAQASAVQEVLRPRRSRQPTTVVRRVVNAAVHVVVVAIGVVVRQSRPQCSPSRRVLQRVDLIDHELLLVDRVGVARVPVLISRRLQETDGRQVVRRQVAVRDRADE